MQLILVAALLVCLMAIHTDAHKSYSHFKIRLSWRRTTYCMYRAAKRLSKCSGVRSRFFYNGKREIVTADENTAQPENDDLLSAKDVIQTVIDDEGGQAGSKSGRRQSNDE